MGSLEKRLSDLAAKLGGYAAYCPVCKGEKRFIVIADSIVSGGEPTTTGERCEACGSPDATVIRVVYDERPPLDRRAMPRSPRYAWDDEDSV